MLAEFDQGLSWRIHTRRISPTLVRILTQTFDPVLVGVAGILCYVVYLLFKDASFESQYVVAILAGIGVSTILFHWFDVYDQDSMFSRRLPIQRLLSAWAVAFATLLFIAFALKISESFSRIWAVAWFFVTAGSFIGGRLLLSQWIVGLAREGVLAERSVILGAGEQGQQFAAQMRKTDDPCMEILGFIDDRKTRVPEAIHGYQILGDTESLLNMIRANEVDQVFVALPWGAGQRLAQVINQLALTPVRICLVMEPLGFELPNREIRYVNKMPALQVFDRPLTGWSYVTKAIEDRVIAAGILLFTAPLMMLIALAIKLDSPGPVFFRQQRYGFNNNLIDVWKFRTMFADRTDPGGAVQASKNDPRVTRVGRLLRKASLDELPQFINVFLGDMSIVGPRPHPIDLTSGGQRFEEIVDRYAARHRVKPGITGWAQVNGWRGETDTLEKVEQRVEHDLYYIDNWSVWFDLLIILKTIVVVFGDDHAY